MIITLLVGFLAAAYALDWLKQVLGHHWDTLWVLRCPLGTGGRENPGWSSLSGRGGL